MTIDSAGYARIPAILSFPDTAGFAETYGFGAASGRVWLDTPPAAERQHRALDLDSPAPRESG